MATKLIKTTGGDYSTLAGWAAYVNALSLSANEIGEVDGTVTDTATVTIGGWTPNGFTVTLRAVSGQRVSDGGRLWWLTSGRAILTNSVSYAGAYTFADSTLTVQGLQIRRTSSTNGYVARAGNGAVIEQCVIMQDAANDYVTNFSSGGGTFRTCLIIAQADGCKSDGETGWLRRCTLVALGTGGTGLRSFYSALGAQGCAVYGFGTIANGTAVSGSGYNAISGSTWGGTGWDSNGQTGLVSADFVDTGSGTEDYSVASGSTKLKDTGTSISGVTVDLFNTSIPQGSAEDIGAHEVSAGGGQPPRTMQQHRLRRV